MGKCRLCDGDIRSSAPGQDAHVCSTKTAIQPDECWLNSTSRMKVFCAKSLSKKPVTRFDERAAAFRQVGDAIDKSDMHLRNALFGLTPDQRYEVMHNACKELKVRLSPLLAEIQSGSLQPPDREALIPDELPDGLKSELIGYRDRLIRRHELLVKRGHKRSHKYVSNLLILPVKLARFLHDQGISTWDAMRQRDVVRFLAANPLVRPTALSRLMRALSEDKPFSEKRGRYVRGRKSSKPLPLQEVLSPDELQSVLNGIKESRSDAEYAAAWLVAKLGMTASAAHGLTVDRLKLDDAGRLVIRPAKVWVVVPKSVAHILTKIADEMAPGWKTAQDDEFAFIRLFDGKLPNINNFRSDVLLGDARRLRASAVYTAMLRGTLDRVTLNQTMGVSIATITSIERHLSVDVHRKLDCELVAERNKILRGDEDAYE